MSKKNRIANGADAKNMQKRQPLSKNTKIVIVSIVGVLTFIFVLNMIILPFTGALWRTDNVDFYSGPNPYIVFDETGGLLLSAHRAGAELEPEETMAAFKNCIEAEKAGGYRVDVMEFDLHLTKDNQLVLLHDHEVDRTSDGPEVFGEEDVKVKDKTLEELKQLNFGYNFVDKNGEYKYRKPDADLSDVRILTLDEVLDYLENSARPNKSLKYIIEIKDGGDTGKQAVDMLYQAMKDYGIIDRTIVGTFKSDVTDYIDENYRGEIVRSADILEVLNFYYAFLWGRKLDVEKLGYRVLQIPMYLTKPYFNFSTEAFVDYAHTYGIAVQYWTINEPDDVKHLKEIGADCIMTDNPEMAYEVLHS